MSERRPLVEDVVILGSSLEADVRLEDAMVSRRHVELRREGARWLVTDLGSRNGSTVDGVALVPHQSVELRAGAPLQIVGFTLQLEVAESDLALAGRGGSDIVPAGLPNEGGAEAPATADGLVHAAALDSGRIASPEAERTPRPAVGGDRSPPAAPVDAGGRPTPENPRPLASGPSRYLRYLPAPYQEQDFIGRFLMIFEVLWEPMEARQDAIDQYFQPSTAPVSFLPWLASWMGLEIDPRWPEERKRELVARGIGLLRERGTRHGLAEMVKLCTGAEEVVVEEDPIARCTLRISVQGAGLDLERVTELVRRHKPVHAVAQLSQIKRGQ